MFEKASYDRLYHNPLVDRNSSLFCPRQFARTSRLPDYLAANFPYVFVLPLPDFFGRPCITLYVILQLLYQHLNALGNKEFDLIYIPPELFAVLGVNMCTKAELKNLVKSHLEPIEHFELDLFDPTEHCQIPHEHNLFLVWNIRFMVKFPHARRFLALFALTNLKFDLHPALKHRIEANERRFDPNFQLTTTTAKEIFDLTIRLIIHGADVFLDPSNIQVLIPPITWYFTPQVFSPNFDLNQVNSIRTNYIHVSDFPKRLFTLMTICRQ